MICFAGNPNSGKTALFNRLTGSNLRVGNFPGVTVEGAHGELYGGGEAMDLPGTYSLRPFTPEEEVTARALENADAILNTVDATSPARGLYLTLQLRALHKPMLVVLTMTDELEKRGGRLAEEKLERLLGVRVVSSGGLHGSPEQILRALKKLPAPRGGGAPESPEAAYRTVDAVLAACFTPPHEMAESRMDRLLCGRGGLPLLLGCLLGMLAAAFAVSRLAGKFALTPFFGVLKAGAGSLLEAWGVSPFFSLLVQDGVLGAAEAMTSFLPLLLALFFLLSLLEDTGWLARAAFVTNGPLQKCGLSGRSIVPLLTGLGCSVPGILAARTDLAGKRATACAVPLVPCSARLPVLLYVLSPVLGGGTLPALLLFVLCGIGCALLSSYLSAKGKPAPFLLELPPWRFPSGTSLWRQMRLRSAGFFKRTFAILFLAGLLLWLPQHLDGSLRPCLDGQETLLALGAAYICPVFAPLGFAVPEAVAALFAGLGAKEAIVGALASLSVTFPLPAALSFAAFSVLYCPCLPSLITLSREVGVLRAAGTALKQTAFAYGVALVVYTAASLL